MHLQEHVIFAQVLLTSQRNRLPLSDSDQGSITTISTNNSHASPNVKLRNNCRMLSSAKTSAWQNGFII